MGSVLMASTESDSSGSTESSVGLPTPLLTHFPTDREGGTKILAYGDSLTTGFSRYDAQVPYGEELGKALRELEIRAAVWVCGHPGRTARWMVGHLDAPEGEDEPPGLRQLINSHGPFDLVMIMAGTNDLGYATKPQRIFSKLALLHSACHELCVPTLALTIPPSRWSLSGKEGHDAWKAVNQLLTKWSRNDEAPAMLRGCVEIDRILPYDDESGCWHEDGLHCTPKGYTTLGRNLAGHVARNLKDQSAFVAAS